MTNAVIKSVLLLTPGGSSTPIVTLAKGDSTGQYYEGNEVPQNLVYQGNMTYGTNSIDTLDADFPADGSGTISVQVNLNPSTATFSAYPTDINGDALTDVSSTSPLNQNSLTLVFTAPSERGQTTGYTEMIFPTSLGYIDPDEETEREPN